MIVLRDANVDESGIVHINDQTVHDEPQVPFGGVKDSGWGRSGGRAALDQHAANTPSVPVLRRQGCLSVNFGLFSEKDSGTFHTKEDLWQAE